MNKAKSTTNISFSEYNLSTNKLIKVGNVYPKGGQAGFIYDGKGVCPTLVTFTGGGGKQPIVKTYQNKPMTNSNNSKIQKQ